MASKDERKLARTIVDLERRLNASRAKQLPFTSVALDDGTEQGVADGVAAGRDAYDIAAEHDGILTDIGDISDASAVESTFLPERLAIVDGSADAAFDLSLIAAGRVGEALAAANEAAAAAAGVSELAEGARTAANAAQTAAEAASTTAAQAKAEAEQASADATSKAAAAEAAAKEYATAQAAAAESAAKAAASDDATAKAQAAEDAAKLAAAADAKAKADAAQAAAEEKAAAAQSTANGAASAASEATARANAVRELALQNARYRQVDGGSIEPAEPEGGFRINAQRVKVDVNGKPYQVDRWSGTSWVLDEVLASQLLIVGPNGVVQIVDGVMITPEMYGGLIEGAIVRGGLVEQVGATPDQGAVVHPVKVSSPAIVGPAAGAAYSTTSLPAGVQSTARVRTAWASVAGRQMSTLSAPDAYLGATVRLRVRIFMATAGSISRPYPETPLAVPANTWVELTSPEIEVGPDVNQRSYSFSSATQFWMTEPVVEVIAAAASTASMSSKGSNPGLYFTRNGFDSGSITPTEMRLTDRPRFAAQGRGSVAVDARSIVFREQEAGTGAGNGLLSAQHQLRLSGDSVLIQAASVSTAAPSTFQGPAAFEAASTFKAPSTFEAATTFQAPVAFQGASITSDRSLNMLWSGAPVYLRASQVATLSEPVSKQLSGIILVWSEYANGAANNSGWVEYFVPKTLVAAHPGNGHTMGIRSAWGAECAKYAYVHDDRITGNDVNQTAPNNTYVLRYVYGV